MDTLKLKNSLEEHCLLITDVRFSPNSTRLATSSFDKTVRVWDADNVSPQPAFAFLVTSCVIWLWSSNINTDFCSGKVSCSVWKAKSIFDSWMQPSYSLRTFTGHQTSVMSLDFHPNNEDLLCSCDGDSEIRYWSVNQGVCTRVSKVCCMLAEVCARFLTVDRVGEVFSMLFLLPRIVSVCTH